LKSLPQVSIVINCYNGESYLHDSINSVINQSYKNWEIVFWDNGSYDKTSQIIKDYQKKTRRIRYFFNEKNEKLGIARNKALENCNGKYITFLDVDDIYNKNALEILVRSIEKQGVVLCYGGVENINEEGQAINSVMPKFKTGNLFNDLLMQFDIHVPSVIISNDLIKKNKYYINSKLECSEEFNLFMKIALHHNVCSIPKVISKYRIRNDSLTVATLKRHGLERRITLNELIEKNPKLKETNKKELKEAFARSKYYDARYLLMKNQKIKGIKLLSKIAFVNYRYTLLFLISLMPNYLWIKIHEIKNRRN
tara:strand:- start:3438 stop:4367 length:930 start_codon:yes stop_codon:yes gene_type:complete